jgi:hypothetical protein
MSDDLGKVCNRDLLCIERQVRLSSHRQSQASWVGSERNRELWH